MTWNTTTLVRERPMLFSGEMVKAILDGRKTQTRRICKTIKDPDFGCEIAPSEIRLTFKNRLVELSPFGFPGDLLWVKETFCPRQLASEPTEWIYRADGGQRPLAGWKPSIFMPRKASRITLEITGIRVERLREISEEDAIAEGINTISHGRNGIYYHAFNRESSGDNWSSAIDAYKELWESINGAGSWNKNPWVWVIEFQLLNSQTP